jgi:peptide/nickel transport system ATP-binding protein
MKPTLEVTNLEVQFKMDEGVVRAVDDVSFSLEPGKTLGIVGESGSGKSVIGQSILRIVPHPGSITAGKILLRTDGADGAATDLTALNPHSLKMRGIRGRDIAMVFQEPMNSFSPVHTIGSQIVEAIRLHKRMSKAEAKDLAAEMLSKVGIPRPKQRVESYPHELSGGMRQRAMIAMALACNPKILIADEPTTALDVTIQAQILNLLQDLQDEFGMAMLFISHNLGVISEVSHEVMVVYFGKVMEHAPVDVLFKEPLHPYTRALLRSIPGIDTPVRSRLATIEGSLPDPYLHIAGCPFEARCLDHGGQNTCGDRAYELFQVADRHFVSCPSACARFC